MKLTNTFFGVPEDDTYFNLPAATEAYERIMKMDDAEARSFASALVFDGFTAEIEKNKSMLQDTIDAYVFKTASELRHRLGQQYISKRANGEDASHLLAAAEAIAKAVGDGNYSPEERRINAAEQLRVRGRFADMNRSRFNTTSRNIKYNTRDRALNAKEAAKLGVKLPEGNKANLKKENLANFHEAYLQVQDYLKNELDGLPVKDAIVNYTYSTPGGKLVTETELADNPKLDPMKFRGGGKLENVEVRVARDLSVEGAGFDLAAAMVNPRFAAFATQAAPKAGKAVDDFEGEWNRYESGDIGNNNRAYRKIGAASTLIDTLVPESMKKTKLAVAFGNWVGEHGPQAEKVLGPGMRKTSYRYRGVERKPDEQLVSVVENSPRERVIFPTKTESAKGQRIVSVDTESPVIQYFVSRLPKQELYTLQRKSGTIPPSEGIIIDRQGRVVTQAVGYGDDWYLPFNLRNLGKLQGGEYIRTRAIGGPTTEDIYAGMISGARRVTVVSRSGVFTVEFDETFRGTRRYSDKASRMVSRYGQLLDAVGKGNITPSTVPAERMAEFRAEAEARFGEDDERAIADYIERAKEKEKTNPRLAALTLEKLKTDVLMDAAAKVQTSNGMPMTMSEYNQYLAGVMTRDFLKEYPELVTSRSDLQAQTNKWAQEFATNPDKALKVAGLTEEYANRVEQEQKNYAATLRPMRLDGQGYAFALEALREQFPYYVKKITNRPVTTLNGIAQGSASEDFGYIKPKFIRPEGALGGYYDTTIAGTGTVSLGGKLTGKVTADQMYYQNEGVPRYSRDTEGPSTPSLRGGEGTSRPNQPRSEGRISDAMAATDLVTHIRGLRTKEGATFNGVALPAGRAIADESALKNSFPILFAKPIEDISDAMIDPNSDMKTRLEEEVKRFQRDYGSAVDIDRKLVAAFNNQTPTKAFSVKAALLDPQGEFEFNDSAFDPGRDPAVYKARYNSPGPMANVRKDLDLGEIDDKDNMAKIDAALDNFRQLQRAQDKWEEGSKSSPRPIKNKDIFDANVKNVVQAKTLIRRYEVESLNASLAPNPLVVMPDRVITQVYAQDANGNVNLVQGEPGGQVDRYVAPAGTSLVDITDPDFLSRQADEFLRNKTK